MESTPKGNRLHIGVFGRCNVGKSTLINLLAEQSVSLVSPVAGTTTDPVTKAMEILPLGPVVLTDTAGVDDTSELGQLRIAKTKSLLPKMNGAIYIVSSTDGLQAIDKEWLQLLINKHVPTLLLVNDFKDNSREAIAASFGDKKPALIASFAEEENRDELLTLLSQMPQKDEEEQSLLEGLVEAGDFILLVCPIDESAPKGRLILPQVQMIREILDHHAMALVVQVDELATFFQGTFKKPTLVITDSQAFEEVNALLPTDIPLTSFSILMARFKGRLKELVHGAYALQNLQAHSKVLISEGCTHRRQCNDIGTVKIPRWLEQRGYKDLDLSWTSGGEFPEDVSGYDLIIHCGACMLSRREVLNRLEASMYQGVPMVNYGVLIASLHGILERALSPFTEELK